MPSGRKIGKINREKKIPNLFTNPSLRRLEIVALFIIFAVCQRILKQSQHVKKEQKEENFKIKTPYPNPNLKMSIVLKVVLPLKFQRHIRHLIIYTAYNSNKQC